MADYSPRDQPLREIKLDYVSLSSKADCGFEVPGLRIFAAWSAEKVGDSS